MKKKLTNVSRPDKAESAIDALTKAKALIIEKGWTQGAFARDDKGMVVSYHDPNATSYCMLGAVAVAVKDDGACENVANEALHAVVPGGIAMYNDKAGLRKATVIKRFDEAIAALRALAPKEETNA